MTRSQSIQLHVTAWHELQAAARTVRDAAQPAAAWHWRQVQRICHPERFVSPVRQAIAHPHQQLSFWGAA